MIARPSLKQLAVNGAIREVEIILRYVGDDDREVLRLEVDAVGYARLREAVLAAVNEVTTWSRGGPG